LKYKWIASEKAGRDLGEAAILAWAQKHWYGYLRRCWMEHLQGYVFWSELDQNDFGLLNRKFQDCDLIDEIVLRLEKGWENLDIILWAQEEELDEEQVMGILHELDINGHRLECQLGIRLAQVG